MLLPETLVALRQSLHDVEVKLVPKSMTRTRCQFLRERLQPLICACDGCGYDAILLGLGLCGYGVVGLRAGKIPLVIARGPNAANYWQTEAGEYPHSCRTCAAAQVQPGTPASSLEQLATHGLDDLKQDLLTATAKHHFHHMPAQDGGAPQPALGAIPLEQMVLQFPDSLEGEADQEAAWFGWDFHLAQGELNLVIKLLSGDWKHEDFLIVPPGWRVISTARDGILNARAAAR